MLGVLRKNQQVLMLIVAIMTIVAFIWLYNRTNLGQVGSNDVASVYGRVVQRAEVDRMQRGYGLALALGLTGFVKDLGGMGSDEQASFAEYLTNLLIIRHQAPLLGVHPTDQEVVAEIRTLDVFRTDGAFDPAKYASFLQERLAPNGFTEVQLEEIVRDALRVRQLRRIVTSPVAVGEGQVRQAARVYQAVSGEVLRFDRKDYAAQADVTDQEIQTFYSKNKDGLRAPETRDFTYAVLELKPDAAKLTGKEKAAALQSLADKGLALAREIRTAVAGGSGFAPAATSRGLTVRNASLIDRQGEKEGKDAGLAQTLVEGAFGLKAPSEISDIIQDGDTFYILSLDKVTPTRQLELAEVSAKITDYLKGQKEAKLLVAAATKAITAIRAAMTSGKTFDQAVGAQGLKTLSFQGVVPSDAKADSENQAYAASTLTLSEGMLGELQPAPYGAFAVCLTKRAPLSDDQWKEHGATLQQRILGNERDLLFMEWLRSGRAAAQIRMLGGNGRGSGS